MPRMNVLHNHCLKKKKEKEKRHRSGECVTARCLCGCVQIVRLDRTMEQIVFPVPNICEFLTQESKLRVYYTTERDEQGSKINDFFLRSEDLFNEMNWQKKLRGTQEATGNTNTVPCASFSSTFLLSFGSRFTHSPLASLQAAQEPHRGQNLPASDFSVLLVQNPVMDPSPLWVLLPY